MSTVQTYRWTREAYERLGEQGVIAPDRRVELIDGTLIDMSPQSSLHATAVRKVDEALRTALGSGYDVRTQLPLALSETDEPEPDVAVVRGRIDDYRDAHPTTAALVVEVADSSLDFDRTTKAAMYARAGIADYWIVNVPDRHVEVYRDPRGDLFGTKRTLGADASLALHAEPEATIAVRDCLP